MTGMHGEDTKPWYRHFWPWFIIAMLGASVTASLTTVWISMQTTDSLVLHAEDGVRNAADRRVAAERLASELGLAAVITFDAATGMVSAVMQRGELATLPTALEFELSHPAFAERDIAIALHKALPDAGGNPVWVGHLATVPQGRWYAVLKSGEDWRLSAEWRGETSLTLRPANANRDDPP